MAGVSHRPKSSRLVRGARALASPSVAKGLGGLLLTLAVSAVIAAPFAVLTASVDRQFGPHDAVYSLDASGTIDISLGPLGSIEMPAEEYLPLGLGLRAEVGEIPAEVGLSSPNSIDSLGQDVTAYATFFSAPENQIDDVRQALIGDIVLRLALAAAALTAAWYLGRVVVGTARRRELGQMARSHPYTAAALVGVLVLGTGVGYVVTPRAEVTNAPGDAVFDGTALEGARITGRLAGVVDSASRLVTDFLDENEAFYTRVSGNLRPALGLPAAGESAVTPEPSATPEDDLTTFLLVSDMHCNVGMNRIVNQLVFDIEVDALLDAGDLTMTGTQAENSCVSDLADAVPESVEQVFVKGNHDSQETVDAQKAEGVTVLDGDVTEIGGVRIFGDGDPRRTVFGGGTELEPGETTEGFGPSVAEQACRERPDVVLVHDPRSAGLALEEGCAPLSLSGHWHRRVGPEVFGRGVRYVNSTTGGALANALTPGPLRMTAEMTLLRFDPETGRAVDYRVISVDPDAQVSASDWEEMPSAEVQG